MMQPPTQSKQPQVATAEPTRLKRKRPPPPPTTTTTAHQAPLSETDNDDNDKTKLRKTQSLDGEEARSVETTVAAATTTTITTTAATTGSDASAPAGRPFRGKCLYQSRKCENERALKRNGKAHNLCDEHRSKQNQHQRKFDAKKYTRRKRKGSDGDDDDEDEEAHGDDGHASEPQDAGSEPARRQAPLPPPKRRVVAAANKPQPGTAVPQHQHRHQHRGLEAGTTTTASPHTIYHHRPQVSAPMPMYHESRPMDVLRPPLLQVMARAPPSTTSPFAHTHAPPLPLGQVRSPPATFGHVLGPYPPVTPVDRHSRPLPPSSAYPFLSHHHHQQQQQLRSLSFDSGVTRISPMGGAALGSAAEQPFDRQRQFLEERILEAQRLARQSAAAVGSHCSPAIGQPDKLPSLHQLPMGQLARGPRDDAFRRQPSPPFAQQSRSPPPSLGGHVVLPSFAPFHTQQPPHASSSSSSPHLHQPRVFRPLPPY